MRPLYLVNGLLCVLTDAVDGWMQVGLASALETLCGQAYGAKQYHLLGIYMQRAFIILVTASMPICLIWLNMERILLAMGQDPEIVRAAYSYTMWLIPLLFLQAILLPLIKFFQTQRAVFLLLISTIITVCFHVPLCWLIIYKLDLGFKGVAYALNISLFLEVVCLSAFVRFDPRFNKTFESFTTEAFQDFGEFFRLAIPAAIMMWYTYNPFFSSIRFLFNCPCAVALQCPST
jgi:MATE family multidrug resistance protein